MTKPNANTLWSLAMLCTFVLATAVPTSAQTRVTVERVTFANQPNAHRLSNGVVDVVVTTDMGPRILRYGFAGGENMLGAVPEASKKTELGEWRPVGGHRLWAAPESVPRTYAADNDPVAFKVEGSTIRLTAPIEKGTGLQKEMVVTLAPEGTEVTVLHRVTNRGLWAVELAPWALTIMRGGGVAIIPNEAYVAHSDDTLLPVRTLSLWSYSDLSDPRFGYGRKYLRVRSDPAKTDAIKLGVANSLGWAAYAVDGMLFVKRFPFEPGADYPDKGSNTEIYTEGSFLEVETLAPMRRLEPGQTAEHTERWYLFKGVDVGTTDASVDAAIAPLLPR
jgi:hypothetical protein